MNIYGLAVFSKIWISLVSGFHQKNSINIFPRKKRKKTETNIKSEEFLLKRSKVCPTC